MIRVVRLDGQKMVLNAEQIQSVENTPDTIITMLNGTRVIVKNTLDEVVQLFLDYKRDLDANKFQRKP